MSLSLTIAEEGVWELLALGRFRSWLRDAWLQNPVKLN